MQQGRRALKIPGNFCMNLCTFILQLTRDHHCPYDFLARRTYEDLPLQKCLGSAQLALSSHTRAGTPRWLLCSDIYDDTLTDIETLYVRHFRATYQGSRSTASMTIRCITRLPLDMNSMPSPSVGSRHGCLRLIRIPPVQLMLSLYLHFHGGQILPRPNNDEFLVKQALGVASRPSTRQTICTRATRSSLINSCLRSRSVVPVTPLPKVAQFSWRDKNASYSATSHKPSLE